MELDRSTELPVSHYYRLSVPAGNRGGNLPLLVALHGYAGDMVSMMRLAKAIAGEELIVAALQGPHQFWVPSPEAESSRVGFGWGTPFIPVDSQVRHRNFVDRVVADSVRDHGADPARVFLLGFSQACAHNYRLAFTRPKLARGVVAVCGGLPGDFDEPRYERYPGGVLHVAATDDQFYPLEKARTFEPALRRLAQDVTFREYESPHAFPRRAIPDIRIWILDRC